MDILSEMEDNDSDLEILEPEVLRKHYRREELRLITTLCKYPGNQIPKKWEDFQMFVKNVVKFYLSPYLVRSVWAQLHACYQLANRTNSCSFVEIIDEEVVEKSKENKILSNVGGVNHEELHDDMGGKSNAQLSSHYVAIVVDEEEEKQGLEQHNYEHFINIGVSNEESKFDKGRKSNYNQLSDRIETRDEDVIIVDGIDKELKCNFEEKKRNNDLVSDCDEESNIRRVLSDDSKPEINCKISINPQLPDHIKINDEGGTKNKDHMTSNYFYKKIDTPKEIATRRSSRPTLPKRNGNRLRSRRRKIPNSMEEAEAEALREKLLLDKIIELELPQVIKTFITNYNTMNHSSKKRKKSLMSMGELLI